MAMTNAAPVADIVAITLRNTIKAELKARFVALIVKDIEPILEDYANQIAVHVQEMRDPASFDGLKLNILFKLPEVPR